MFASRAASPVSPGTRASLPLTITWAMASASTPSVPGATAIHSSALMPVSDIRGATETNFAIAASRPASNPWAREKPFWKPTGESQVSMKSAPNERMYLALAKS